MLLLVNQNGMLTRGSQNIGGVFQILDQDSKHYILDTDDLSIQEMTYKQLQKVCIYYNIDIYNIWNRGKFDFEDSHKYSHLFLDGASPDDNALYVVDDEIACSLTCFLKEVKKSEDAWVVQKYANGLSMLGGRIVYDVDKDKSNRLSLLRIGKKSFNFKVNREYIYREHYGVCTFCCNDEPLISWEFDFDAFITQSNAVLNEDCLYLYHLFRDGDSIIARFGIAIIPEHSGTITSYSMKKPALLSLVINKRGEITGCCVHGSFRSEKIQTKRGKSVEVSMHGNYKNIKYYQQIQHDIPFDGRY